MLQSMLENMGITSIFFKYLLNCNGSEICLSVYVLLMLIGSWNILQVVLSDLVTEFPQTVTVLIIEKVALVLLSRSRK